jgi:hypothetical protein
MALDNGATVGGAAGGGTGVLVDDGTGVLVGFCSGGTGAIVGGVATAISAVGVVVDDSTTGISNFGAVVGGICTVDRSVGVFGDSVDDMLKAVATTIGVNIFAVGEEGNGRMFLKINKPAAPRDISSTSTPINPPMRREAETILIVGMGCIDGNSSSLG